MSRFFTRLIVYAAILVGVFAFVRGAGAATVSVMPAWQAITDQEQLVVDIRFSSDSQVINAVQAQITYPANILDVVDVSRGGSFLTLWPQVPTVNKTAGTISFVGGIPNGSRVEDGRLVRVIFVVQATGDVEIGFNQQATSAYLNDGLGTPAELAFNSGLFKIIPAVFIDITSPTHPDENAWYRNQNPVFQWSVKPGAVYSYILTDDPEKNPDNLRDPAEGVVAYKDRHDGIYYFILSEKKSANQWSLIGKRRVMIDTTPPAPIQGIIQREATMYDNRYFISFNSQDAMSGIDHFEVIEGGKTFIQGASPYILKDQSLRQAIIIRAVDKAGNTREAVFGNAAALRQRSMTTILIQAVLIILALLLILAALRLTAPGKNPH
jgi:hypothetical protein